MNVPLPNPLKALRDLLGRRSGSPGSPGEEVPQARDPGLGATLRQHTRALHGEAERSGVVRDILAGQVTRRGLALLLRNLLPAYQQLERGLDHHRQTPLVGPLVMPALYRAPPLEAGLINLEGPDWARVLPLLPAAEDYARQIATAAEGDGIGLLGHAYVRYLGDLSGGQVLARLLAQTLGLAPQALAFYDFRDIADLDGFKVAYRDALDRVGRRMTAEQRQTVLAAAAQAFQCNIQISVAARAALLAGRAAP